MKIWTDIETVPAEDRQKYLDEAKENFKAPSSLTKGQAGADLGITGDKLKYTSADDIKAQWEKEMASVKSEEVGDQLWRKTALDGTYGRCLAVGWSVGDSPEVSYCDPTKGSEGDMIQSTFDDMAKALATRQPGAHGRKPLFIGHNIPFDLKFLFRRAVILGIKPPFELPFYGRHNQDYYCTSRAWCEYGERISLDNLCRALGIEGKNGFDGSMVCDAWLNGEEDRIKTYCADDVRKAKLIYERLNFVTG